MDIGRKLLIGLLAFGTVAGYACGFASFAHCARGHHEARRAAFEAHVADVCTRAALRAHDADRPFPHQPPPRDLPRDDGHRHGRRW